MKPYGLKHKKTGPCVCEMCIPSKGSKLAIKRRARQQGKKEISKQLKD